MNMCRDFQKNKTFQFACESQFLSVEPQQQEYLCLIGPSKQCRSIVQWRGWKCILRGQGMKNRFKISFAGRLSRRLLPSFPAYRKGHLRWMHACRWDVLVEDEEAKTNFPAALHKYACLLLYMCVYYTFKFIIELRKFMFARHNQIYLLDVGGDAFRCNVVSVAYYVMVHIQDIWFDFQVTYPSLSMSFRHRIRDGHPGWLWYWTDGKSGQCCY